MKKVIHKAGTRGHANHGWLDSHHSFSFAGYYDPARMNFGNLRVLNDDVVAGGEGFGSHPHDNMEIISIPLKGSLEHQDNAGNKGVIKSGDVQIMSAGTGIVHAEYNHSSTEDVNFLQLWIFPRERNIKPRYEQKYFDKEGRKNRLQPIVSPDKDDGALWINQDAWLTRTSLNEGKSVDYKLHGPDQGVYLFLLDGIVKAGDEVLGKRDGVGFYDTDSLHISAETDAEVLLIEVPMSIV
jgi:redox-sensitive bicupin YhaK (pirin superfamily)